MRQTPCADIFILLDTALGASGVSRLLQAPSRIIRADSPNEVFTALCALEKASAAGKITAGFFTYELGYVLEPKLLALLAARRALPLLWFGVFDEAQTLSAIQVEEWLNKQRHGDYGFAPPKFSWDEAAYAARFHEAKKAIADGDIYQVNLTYKATFDLLGDRMAFAYDLRRRQPTPYSALINTPDFTIISCSPELFFSQNKRAIKTQPMKGTAKPDVPAESLRLDEKNRAENVMIVDLMRNDIGRLALPGRVRVENLFAVESHATLHQMTSTIVGEMRDDVGRSEMIKALFPPGSVTGTPKIQAVKTAAQLEDRPRGVYTGAIGAFFPDDTALFNVAIRTIVIDQFNHAEIGIGSGIVQDSDSTSEYEECRIKMAFLATKDCDFRLFETIRYDRGNGAYLLERHLARLAASAKTLGFAFEPQKAHDLLQKAVAGRDDAHLRVKLTLDRCGDISFDVHAFPTDTMRQTLRFSLAPERVDSENILLFHKTTRRRFLDDARDALRQKTACDEAVFLNQKDELTQGSMTNLFLHMPGEKILRTPPLVSGLLPGVLRAQWLETGQATEAVLRINDLKRAEAILLGNSLRGLQNAEWLDKEA